MFISKEHMHSEINVFWVCIKNQWYFLYTCTWYFCIHVHWICIWYFCIHVPGIFVYMYLVFVYTCSWYFVYMYIVYGIFVYMYLVFCVHVLGNFVYMYLVFLYKIISLKLLKHRFLQLKYKFLAHIYIITSTLNFVCLDSFFCTRI